MQLSKRKIDSCHKIENSVIHLSMLTSVLYFERTCVKMFDCMRKFSS